MESKIDYRRNVKLKRAFDGGGFSTIYYSLYYGKPYAFKKPTYKASSKNLDKKLIRLTDYYEDKDYIWPYKIIYLDENMEFSGTIMDFKKYAIKLNERFLISSYEDRIKLLKKARILLENLHNKYKIIHADIHDFNFLCVGDDLFLLDFDSYIDAISKNGLDIDLVNNSSRYYLKNYKVDYGVDIFLFNLMTYEALLDKSSDLHFSALNNILSGDYGNFNDERILSILKSYRGENPVKKYIIDYL